MVRNQKIFFAISLFFVLVLFYLFTAYFWAIKTSDLATFQYDQKNKSEASQLSNEQLSNLLKVEDPSFWDNCGVDVTTPGQGKTTITQSVVPILLYKAHFEGWRALLQNIYSKIWSVAKKIDLGRDIMAIAISKRVPKDKILKIFIEEVYMGTVDGKSIFGLSQASHKYFNKSLQQLAPNEFAGLVGMLKSPDYFSPLRNPDIFNDRAKKIQKLLNGYCSPEGLFDTSYKSCI